MKRVTGSLRRWTYLTHRWCGVAGCLLMALWFASGMVMLFIGYPKLTPWDRLAALPALGAAPQLPSQVMGDAPVSRLVLNAASGQARYIVQRADGSLTSVDASNGVPADGYSSAAALHSAKVFSGGADVQYLGSIDEDRWTHSGSLNAHRPLHMVQVGDVAQTLLYVSSRTGEVVMQASRSRRMWNYVGAWLHWLYPLKNQSRDPVWSWTVIALSAGCVLVACSGIVVGLWRWRFARPYKSGSRSPFAPGWMRWHHLLGLGFAAITLTWIFSGLMSMNPLGIFSPTQSPDLARYEGAIVSRQYMDRTPTDILQALQRDGFRAVELEWKNLGGHGFVLARDAADGTRIVTADAQGLLVQRQWPQAVLQEAAAMLLPAKITQAELLDGGDAYYYRRAPEAMMGGAERRLPVLRLRFADAGSTLVYIDPATGQVVLSADRAQRLGRWLFSFLHSWDLHFMLAAVGWREAVLILLSLGGLALSLSGIVIGVRRVDRKMRSRH
ncbi:PepSY domain-containing protein [Herbaspirillum aquaticum]|uniref:Peptidase n=1 Tax=Herbaspirillum aquaticum TaxID=568783 RepID=A0A225SWU3_9BURK|nr:PepSY domain-containing protein [Herbaspirillum aquaticum]OWY35671.1 peptidase [Herbaspirillum aquaticum]